MHPIECLPPVPIKTADDYFLEYRDELINKLLTRAISNGLEVKVKTFGLRKPTLYYRVGDSMMSKYPNRREYSDFRKEISRAIHNLRVRNLAKTIYQQTDGLHDSQAVLTEALEMAANKYFKYNQPKKKYNQPKKKNS